MRRRTLPGAGRPRQGTLDHLALALVGQLPRRLLERHPFGPLDLVVVVGRIAREVLEQEERDDLRDAPALAYVPVVRVAELLHQRGLDARLLAHLAQRGVGGRLALLGVAL